MAGAHYRAICAVKFEKRWPGRIAQKGLKVQEMMLEGQWRRCVLVRKTPQGEWNVTYSDILGTKQAETSDDGSVVLGDTQQQKKYEALADKTRLSADDHKAIEAEEDMTDSDREGS